MCAGTTDYAVAELLRDLDVDIAVDLMGHTAGARPGIFAYRGVPVQVNYLGYPGTMGAPFIDYIIADPFLVPAGSEVFYSEQVVRLPDCYQPNDTKRRIGARTPTRAELGLPGARFRVLLVQQQLQDQSADLRRMDAAAARSGRERAVAAGDERGGEGQSAAGGGGARGGGRAPDVCAAAGAGGAPSAASGGGSISGHVAVQRTYVGERCIVGGAAGGDVCGAVVCGAGGGESAARGGDAGAGDDESVTEYEALALALAGEPARLAGVRERLARNRMTAPLFDIERYRRHLEAAYETMWNSRLRGEAPPTFDVPPLFG